MSIRNIARLQCADQEDYYWLECDKVNMHRIAMRLATRGDDYILLKHEDIYTVIFSKHVSLDMMRTKLKGIEFTVES